MSSFASFESLASNLRPTIAFVTSSSFVIVAIVKSPVSRLISAFIFTVALATVSLAESARFLITKEDSKLRLFVSPAPTVYWRLMFFVTSFSL